MAFQLSAPRQYLADYNSSDTSARAYRIYDKIVNDAGMELRRFGFWDFDKRIARLVFAGQYTTGTVTTVSDSTSLTGSGTTFTSAMDERYIRIGSESVQYRITTFTSTTVLVIETYRGTGAGSLTYSITEPRLALPARFRTMAKPLPDNTTFSRLMPAPLETIWSWRRVIREVGTPRFYAVEWQEDSSIPPPYLWLYPEPADEVILDFPYYAWPDEVTQTTGELYVPLEAQTAFRSIMLGLLYREQGELQKSEAQLGHAQAICSQHLASFRAVGEDTRRAEWSPDRDPCDDDLRRDEVRLASGEPAYE